MPVHEVITFTPSDAFIADPVSTFQNAREFLSKVEGCLSIYGGLAEEEKTAYGVITWETFEHHQAVTQLDGYPGIIGLAPIFGEGDRKLYHVDFNESPDAPIGMKVTEVLTMTLKEGKTKEELAEVLSVLAPKITAEEGCTKPLAWGETREEPGKTFFLLLGWESSKRHYEVVGQSSYETPIANLFAVVDIKMHHAAFKKIL
ncbi:hypothetical protein BDN70DRAFT_870708 [Pholiota conissans]|uniref:ABM domain-containing protein n=1 Tax=Pholiota conissans TaxID=109636 RepID=A0A9P5ZET4_9AGAR|nr:hypothetical protein BDN70DRAFT_870708 [Pholiota conissans]